MIRIMLSETRIVQLRGNALKRSTIYATFFVISAFVCANDAGAQTIYLTCTTEKSIRHSADKPPFEQRENFIINYEISDGKVISSNVNGTADEKAEDIVIARDGISWKSKKYATLNSIAYMQINRNTGIFVQEERDPIHPMSGYVTGGKCQRSSDQKRAIE